MSLPRLFWEGSVMEMGWGGVGRRELRRNSPTDALSRKGVSDGLSNHTGGVTREGSARLRHQERNARLWSGSCLTKARISAPGGCQILGDRSLLSPCKQRLPSLQPRVRKKPSTHDSFVVTIIS